jgi:hypothetical protein
LVAFKDGDTILNPNGIKHAGQTTRIAGFERKAIVSVSAELFEQLHPMWDNKIPADAIQKR